MIPVFYSLDQVVVQQLGASPSARKPPEVIASWRQRGFPLEVMTPEPATYAEFCLAHDPKHVEDVLLCRKSNGFGSRSPEVSRSLPWTTGSLLSAARHALRVGAPVVVSPTSGFHHAGPRKCEGFCTFNGLMVTVLAVRVREDGTLRRIGIIDCDEHYGNGTADIIEEHSLQDTVPHYTYGSEDLWRNRRDAEAWLARLPGIVAAFRGCDLVLYQAGADPHENDPFSRGILSNEHLYQRDLIVFRGLKALGVPVVWNLAGGYQEPLRRVLDIHDNTMRACVEVYGTGSAAPAPG